MEDILHFMREAAPVLAPIFRSDGQARLLAALILAGDEISLTTLADRSQLTYPTAHREVGRLLEAGILAERRAGRTRMVRANQDSPIVKPLREILLVSTGPVVLLAQELSSIEGVEAAFLYGSYAARLRGVTGESPRDIDLMVIGAPDPEAIYDACARVEEHVARPVNPTILTHSEFEADSGFLESVRTSPIVHILGDHP
ncbi:ArsR family transcriptional regulator [Demequina sp. SO4-18]|uniref:ArsR family transcriptional regulator n=1 Tax=Demequina sp. SO4-18 TaxID=3401026 RepID=UPI003B5B6730